MTAVETQFADRTKVDSLTTPYLELDIALALDRFASLSRALPDADIHYAVKANPHPDLLRALAGAGSRFDVASPAEVVAALTVGADPAQLLYSNPVKRRDHIAESAAYGVRTFVVDSLEELFKVAQSAPGAAVLCRLLTSGAGSDWPLSRKFGCSRRDAIAILLTAVKLGLHPLGVSFHVGSQQHRTDAWREPTASAACVFEALRRNGVELDLLDLGGGFPAGHEGVVPSHAAYGRAILSALADSFGDQRPRIAVEPGRGLVGDAGVLVTTVIGVVHRGGARWVYLDAGVFTGLVETLDEAIRYRLETSASGRSGPCVLAGPTCDSADVLYEKRPVQLPLSLAEGDTVRFLSAGAYTSCYSTVGFNGFAPLPTVLV